MTNETKIIETIELRKNAKRIGMNPIKFSKVVRLVIKKHPYHCIEMVAEEIEDVKSGLDLTDIIDDTPEEIASLIDDIWDEVYGY